MFTLVNKTVQLGYDLKVSCDIVCFGQFISLTYQTANIQVQVRGTNRFKH